MARTRGELVEDYKATCAALGDKVLAREGLTEQIAGMDKAIAALTGKAHVLLEELGSAAPDAPPADGITTPHMGIPLPAVG